MADKRQILRDAADLAGLEFTGGKAEVAEPTVTPDNLGNLRIDWQDDGVQVQVNDIESNRRELSCIMSIRQFLPNRKMKWLEAPFRINLLSKSAREPLAKSLENRIGLDWATRIGQVVIAVRRAAEGQREVHVLTPLERPNGQDWLLEPLLERNQPTMLVAAGKTGKSLMSLGLFASVATQTEIIPGIKPGPFGGNCLYLDWETDVDTHRWRLTQICKGAGVPFPQDRIHYIRMSMRLAEDVQFLHDFVLKNNIGFVVDDSLGMATGGDMNGQPDAIAFVNASRAIGEVTTLWIHHVGWGDEKRSTGSRYFENAARSVWLLENEQEDGSSESHLDLTHRRSNNGMRYPAMGMRAEFSDAVRYYREAVSTEKQSVPLQIEDVLSVGRLSLQTIYADMEDVPKNAIRQALQRMVKQGKVQRWEGADRLNPEYGLSVTKEKRHRDVTEDAPVSSKQAETADVQGHYWQEDQDDGSF